MLAEKIYDSPEVWLLRIPFKNVITTETNVFLVRDGSDALVIDMGAPSHEAGEAFITSLEELGLLPEEPRYFFTHLHMDHSGLLEMLLPPGSHIYINSDEMRAADPRFSEWMGQYASYRFQEEGLPAKHAACASAPIEIATPVDISRYNVTVTHEGDEIKVGRFAFQVINLPGHTRGMQALYQPDTGICFSGDQLLFLLSPAIGLFLDGMDSMTAYRDSMRKLMALDIKKLCYSHGELRDDFRQRAEDILAHHERRITEMEKIIQEATEHGESLTGIEVINRIKWKIPSSIDQCEPLQQWLIYAQGVMLLDHAVSTNRIRRISEPQTQGEATVLHRYESLRK